MERSETRESLLLLDWPRIALRSIRATAARESTL
jgi:hypothetical protein